MTPPAAMETVMELFSKDLMVNPTESHVFVVPRLMTHLWRKSLGKDADVMFHVPAGSCFWPKAMHEPLIVAIVLPLKHVPCYRGPWVLRGTTDSDELSKQLVAGFKEPGLHGSQNGGAHA